MRTCAICGRTDKESKRATSPYSLLVIHLWKPYAKLFKAYGSHYAHAECIRKFQVRLRDAYQLLQHAMQHCRYGSGTFIREPDKGDRLAGELIDSIIKGTK